MRHCHAVLISILLSLCGSTVMADTPTQVRKDPQAIIAHRQEALAYATGLQAYLYGYPVIDYLRVMREQINKGLDPNGVYAPINQVAFQENLERPGGMFAGRGPNTSTLYFNGWLDVSEKPLLVDVPDTAGRYYVLTWTDLYSEVQHTGRRTTGTGAQRLLVAGPEWQGEVPAGTHLVRLKTRYGYLLGRVLVNGADDLPAARAVMHGIRLDGVQRESTSYVLPDKSALTSLAFFEHLNHFLRSNPRRPEEALLMAQMNQVGIGPSVELHIERLPEALRRGLQRALEDGHRILADSALAAPSIVGWSKPSNEVYGEYGFDYLRRAIVEFHGFLGNRPEETIYLSTLTDADGRPLRGNHRYEIVFPAGQLPPANAFWALNVYDASTVDLIPNAIDRYAITDRMSDLVYRKDGALVIRLQQTPPEEKNVNWLPVTDAPLFLTLRFFEPAQSVLDGAYEPPPLRRLE